MLEITAKWTQSTAEFTKQVARVLRGGGPDVVAEPSETDRGVKKRKAYVACMPPSTPSPFWRELLGALLTPSLRSADDESKQHSTGHVERSHHGGPFSKIENEQFLKAYEEFGPEAIDKIAAAVPTRTVYVLASLARSTHLRGQT